MATGSASPYVYGTASAVAGSGTAGYAGDNGPATSAQLWKPRRMIVGGNDETFFIADTWNNRVRTVNMASGVITTLAGDRSACRPTPGSTTPQCGNTGAATSASLNHPSGLALSTDGNSLYVADQGSNRVRVVDLSASPPSIDLFAGSGVVAAGLVAPVNTWRHIAPTTLQSCATNETSSSCSRQFLRLIRAWRSNSA